MVNKNSLHEINIDRVNNLENFSKYYLRLSLSCGSIPGKFITKPGGAFDMSNLRTTFRHKPIRTKKLCIVLLTTAIGGCRTFGKKLEKHKSYLKKCKK